MCVFLTNFIFLKSYTFPRLASNSLHSWGYPWTPGSPGSISLVLWLQAHRHQHTLVYVVPGQVLWQPSCLPAQLVSVVQEATGHCVESFSTELYQWSKAQATNSFSPFFFFLFIKSLVSVCMLSNKRSRGGGWWWWGKTLWIPGNALSNLKLDKSTHCVTQKANPIH